VSLFSFADENLEEVVQDPFPKVDWPKAMTRNINHQSRTKNGNEKKAHFAHHLAQYRRPASYTRSGGSPSSESSQAIYLSKSVRYGVVRRIHDTDLSLEKED